MTPTAVVDHDLDVETLPASFAWVGYRLAISALLIPVLWASSGLAAAGITAVALGLCAALFLPRRLVLDREGFRLGSLVHRKKVLWRQVGSFGTRPGYYRSGGAFVCYAKAGRTPRWWYPAGWPAQGAIPPAFAAKSGGSALSARDLCALLNERLARARHGDGDVRAD